MESRPNAFVSSTYRDLIKERKKVKEAVIQAECFPIGMEMFPASDNSSWEEIKAEIDRSDIYVVIVAGRYGSVDADGIGYTEKEYDYAVSRNKPVLAFLHKDVDSLPGVKLEVSDQGKRKLRAFREKIQANKQCNYWKNGDQLSTRVIASLVKQKAKLERLHKKEAEENESQPSRTVNEILSSEAPQKPDEASRPSEPKQSNGAAATDDAQGQSTTPKPVARVAFEPRRNPYRQGAVTLGSRFPQYFIDDLKNRADLVRIIQPYAQDLKKKGRNWMACCPFHEEKTPSFSVSAEKGFYKCFGCGKGGTAFNFLMEMEGLNFPEAVKRVAEISGVPLPEPVDDASFQRSKKQRDEKKQLADQVIELNQVALEFWEKELKGKSKKAKEAREYLAKRGISDEIQQRFRIGFSPDSWDGLLGVLRDFGADEKVIVQSGLVSVNEEKERTYDRFRGRIMFPVLDVNGRPVAFGARALSPDDEPKYLNSPETPAYIKSEHLYGLFQGKEDIRKKTFAILVEGYLDLIALAQFGVTNVAASLGTAFTEQQAKLLGRFSKSVVINYDGDTAGIKAARRAIEQLLPQDFDVKVLVLPDGKDPDDYIRENGKQVYDQARGRAEPFMQFALRTAVAGRNVANAKQKAEAIEDFLPVVSTIRNNIQKRESFDQAMEFFHVEDAGLRRELWHSLSQQRHGSSPAVTQKIARAARSRVTITEEQLLELLISNAAIRDLIVPILEPTDYETRSTAELFQAIVAIHTDGQAVEPETLMTHLGDDETMLDVAQKLIVRARERKSETPIEIDIKAAENCVFTLRRMAVEDRIRDVSREVAMAHQRGDTVAVNELALEQLELEKIHFQLKRQHASL